VINDIDASNGVIHGISRVLFPPPVFSKEQAIKDAIAFNELVSQADCLGISAASTHNPTLQTNWQPAYLF
jgi:hypothetical protein